MTNQRQQLLNKYIDLQLEVLNKLDELRVKVENEDQDIEEVNYGHVGDLAKIKEALTELLGK